MTRLAYPFVEKAAIASNLRDAIALSRMSAREVADKAEVRASHLSRFLRTGSGINPDGIERIAQVIGADVRKIYSAA